MATALNSAACAGPSAASEAFRKCSSDLLRGIQDPELLAWELYSDDVVSETVVDEVSVLGLSAIQRKTKLLSAVRNEIGVDPTKFQNLLTALKKRPPLKSVTEKLETIFNTCGAKMALKARMLYDFIGNTENGELVIQEGEVVTILNRDIGDGWWEGELENGEIGLFPESYVELVSDSVADGYPQSVPSEHHRLLAGKRTPDINSKTKSPAAQNCGQRSTSNTIQSHVQYSKEKELHNASRLGLLERIPDLLKHVSVDAADSDGRTPLYYASWGGHNNVVEELLSRGADVNHQKKTGETPLYIASFNGHQKVVEILLAAGANPDLQKSNGWAPLHAASQEGHHRVLHLLLNGGASVEQETEDGQTALFVASRNGHDHIIDKLLRRKADVNHQEKEGRTPLWEASFGGHRKVIQLLLAAGANPGLQHKNGHTALHVACQEGQEHVIKLLLQAGASVEQRTKRGSTPLSIARSKGHERIVRMLLEASRHRSVKK